jgi:hypothetical protein
MLKGGNIGVISPLWGGFKSLPTHLTFLYMNRKPDGFAKIVSLSTISSLYVYAPSS